MVPDSYKPVQECTENELFDAAERYMLTAIAGVFAATAEVEQYGAKNVVSEELMARADLDHDLGEALWAFAERHFGALPDGAPDA